jgi:hypothetical protein
VGGSSCGTTAGDANTGNGGGGVNGSTSASGRNGGSGVVILRYSGQLPELSFVGAGLTYNTFSINGFRVYQFTSGTGIIRI